MSNLIIGTGAPYLYDYVNSYNGAIDPSTVHIKNTGLNRYFQKYLLQKALSVFKWDLPENWDRTYFLYVLYCWGFLAVFRTDKYGVIPQGCGLKGYNIFYQPTNATICNPLLRGILEPRIDVDCTIIKLQPTYSGIMDIVSYYANLMSLVTEALGVNLLNSKLSYVFGASSKAQAESFKVLYDKMASGEPAVFVDKNLFKDDGTPSWFTFSQNLKESYLGDELLLALRKIDNMFATDIGIPNANTEKRERLNSDEVNANNFETRSKCELWLDTLKEGIEKTNSMFDLSLSVDWREDLKGGDLDAYDNSDV